MSRRILLSLLIPLLGGASAEAQIITAGSTPAGDYLRGVGIAAWGMGLYNLNTAQADQINAQTFIMLNDYIWSCYKNEMKENAEHRRAIQARNAENYQKLHDRIRNAPESTDVMNGDALNAVMRDLWSPKVSDSASRSAQVPLDADVIRRIPFKVGDKGAAFSMGRLSLRGTRRWAVAFQDPAFATYRNAYQRAVENALELAMENQMTDQCIRDIEKAFDQIEDRFRRTPHVLDPRRQTEYSEAKVQLDKMRGSPKLFQIQRLQPVFKEIDTYSGSTVDDLRLFMRRHNLTFAPAETHDERALYPYLHRAMDVQYKRATGAE